MTRLRQALASLARLEPAASARAAETAQELEGQVSMDSLDQFFVTFEVPAGTRAIEIAHDDLSDDNILEWGLVDPQGVFRGRVGGNEVNAVVGEAATSRSHVPRPIAAGTWSVVVGARPSPEWLPQAPGGEPAAAAESQQTDTTRRTCPSNHVPSIITSTCPIDQPGRHTARST